MNFKDILGMALPPVCHGCRNPLVSGEEILCLECSARLDRSASMPQIADSLRDRIALRTPVIAGVYTYFIYTHENLVGQLIRHGKYNDRPDIFTHFGRIFARSLREEHRLAGVDLITAVPMHFWKRLRRGYNQAEILAREIGRECNIEMTSCLRATRVHSSQTRRGAAGRRESTIGLFRAIDPDKIAGRHIAIVDDIITTGSTITAAVTPLIEAGAASVFILALAATSKG